MESETAVDVGRCIIATHRVKRFANMQIVSFHTVSRNWMVCNFHSFARNLIERVYVELFVSFFGYSPVSIYTLCFQSCIVCEISYIIPTTIFCAFDMYKS